MYQNVQCQNASTVSFCILVIADSACGIGMGSHAELQLAQHGACGGGGRIWVTFLIWQDGAGAD